MNKIFIPIETKILYGEGTIETVFDINGINVYVENRVEINSGHAYVTDENDVQIERLSVYSDSYSDLLDFIYTGGRDFEGDRFYDIIYEIHNNNFKGELVFRDHVNVAEWTEKLYNILEKLSPGIKRSEKIVDKYIFESSSDYILEASLKKNLKFKIKNLEIDVAGLENIFDNDFSNFEPHGFKINNIEVSEDSELYNLLKNSYIVYRPRYLKTGGYDIVMEIEEPMDFDNWVSNITKEFLKTQLLKK